jgi:hypothetical protein
LIIIVRYEIKIINANGKKSLYCWHKNKFRNKYLRQPSIDFDFCNISSSCDLVYKGRWLTQTGYRFILRFCEHFTCLSSKIQNAIKLENINNLITSPSSYQCIRRKTWRLMHFPVIHGRHISMECYVCVLGIPKCKFSKQMIKKYLVTEYLFITEGKFLF